ncbi:MAG: hypothetical protein U9N85_01130 [Bacteroidota bacterium]|nr:hypothetical protein [Bacteroidota bacterium]
MAKDRERKTARILYTEQGKTAKDIAPMVKVSEKTISTWVQKYGWKATRTAKTISRDNRIKNIKKIIDGLATDRIGLQNELKTSVKSGDDKERRADLQQEIARIDSGVANWNKTLENVDKSSRITLSTYLYVMDRIFTAMQSSNAELYIKTIAFQEQHINDMAIELG